MYLISIYFDDETNKKIQRQINAVAEKTGNRYMLDAKVPPHITISAFEARNEEEVIHVVQEKFAQLKSGGLTWCSVGAFFPYVIYLTPVLNEYLYDLSCEIDQCISNIEGAAVNRFYRPLQWFPHTTIGKKLEKEEMLKAFQVLQNSFVPFEGKAVRIGLAKPNPHRDLIDIFCKDEYA